jgi:hypothetical protein
VLRSVLEHFAHLNMLQLASHDSPWALNRRMENF